MSKKRRHGDFVPLKRVLGEVLKNLKVQSADRTKQAARIWEELVGEELAALSRVRGVAGRTVEVEVDGSAVLAEVKQFFRTTFVEKLKAEGLGEVDRVSFQLADR